MMKVEEIRDELVKLTEDCLNNFSTDGIILIKEKLITKNEFVSSPEKVKENVLYFFNLMIEASKENTKTAV